MLDVRIPMGLLFVTLGALLFFYGMFISEPVPFYTPNAWFPLKLNQPVGAFMFMFGLLMLLLARFIKIHTTDRELALREQELDKAERKRQRALAKRELADAQVLEAGGESDASTSVTKESNSPDHSPGAGASDKST